MAPILFIAVQCCQCCTMQVKQKKKSSNKWNCVICNQKQSLRKVFAQGFMAKDVRSFVQSFNMSRKSLDEQSHFAGTLTPVLDEQTINDENELKISVNQMKKRSNWAEYLDPEDHCVEEQERELEQNGDGFETKIVTELEKGMFKKARLENYSIGSGSGGISELFKPRFSKRSTNGKTILQEEPIKDHQTLTANNLKGGKDVTSDDQMPRKCQPRISISTSKWNDYITEEDDRFQHRWKRAFKDYTNPWNSSVLETMTNEQRVEDDIHPDFL